MAPFEKELAQVTAEKDAMKKHLLLAALCSRIFQERGVDLVVVGGSAIEFYTEGAYMSGDVDMCVAKAQRQLTIRDRQELMGALNAVGGPRSWQVSGIFIDILGDFENLARTPSRTLVTPLGKVALSPPEELIVERILVAKYPGEYPPALDCARKMIAVALAGHVGIDWNEVLRIAKLPAYGNETTVQQVINEQAKALAVRSPYDSD